MATARVKKTEKKVTLPAWRTGICIDHVSELTWYLASDWASRFRQCDEVASR